MIKCILIKKCCAARQALLKFINCWKTLWLVADLTARPHSRCLHVPWLHAVTSPRFLLSIYISSLHPSSAGYNNLEVAEYLLEHGADVNAQDKGGLIPLHNAASYGVGDTWTSELYNICSRFCLCIGALKLLNLTVSEDLFLKFKLTSCHQTSISPRLHIVLGFISSQHTLEFLPAQSRLQHRVAI